MVVDVNDLPKDLEDKICENRQEIERTFSEIQFPINNNQLATAMVLASMLSNDKRLLC